MSEISLARVRELVEARFAEVCIGAAVGGSYTLCFTLPESPLNERDKRAAYRKVIAFADQLKRQIDGGLLVWLALPQLRFVGNCYFPPADRYELSLTVAAMN